MNNLHVKTGDNVMIISGRTRATLVRSCRSAPLRTRSSLRARTWLPSTSSPAVRGEQGGIVKAEGAMYASKVMPICPKCGKAVRVGHVEKDGKMVRVCKKCGAEL